MKLETMRISPHELLIPRQGDMLTDATVFASRALRLQRSAVEQLTHGAAIQGVRHAVATPDIHHGFGVPIGSIIGLQDRISPAAVGYDINCGMRMLRTDLQATDVDLDRLAGAARAYIPLGEGKSNVRLNPSALAEILAGGVGALPDVRRGDHPVWDMIDSRSIAIDSARIEDGGSLPGDPAAVSKRAIKRGSTQLATLGGGNHFIEFQIVDELLDPAVAQRFGLRQGQLVVMIHSGSRGLGHQVGSEAMRTAKRAQKSAKVAWLEMDSADGRDYFDAMNAAANYAFVNRHLMGLLVTRALQETYHDSNPALVYDVPHNIAKKEEHSGEQLMVHRKGATRAFGPRRMAGTSFADTGQPVLIPGSMGTASYLLSGVDGNNATLNSVNHGAGRVMSRTAARGKYKGKRQVKPAAISDQQFETAMEGVLLMCENRRSIKEEAPQAYKDIDLVMETVTAAGLGNLVARMRPLAVLKG